MSNRTKHSSIQWIPLLISLFIPLAVGGLSAWLTSDSMEVYKNQYQPPLAPPGWLFPIVWTVLFLLMGVASYLVWQQDGAGRDSALLWYGIQLVCNFFWTLIFFNMQQYGLAFFWLAGLWVLILVTVVCFFREVPAAGWLMIPYLLWVTFAGYLNMGVWLLNRQGGRF